MAERTRSHVGKALDITLGSTGTTQDALAKATRYSLPMVNQIITGRRQASPQWIDLVADALNFTDQEREELHRRAALDAGFRIDLTKR